jgi:N-acetyl-alpha-D-glucosaminyl L-malate synthase BshA
LIADALVDEPICAEAGAAPPIRVGFVLHVMQVAGAEVLVAETIRRLGRRITPVVFCLDAVGALGEQMRAEGVDVVAFGRRPGFDARVIWRLARQIRQRNLEVLHAHQYTPFFYGALAAAVSRTGTRIVFTEHGRHWPDLVSAKRRLVNRLVLDRLADRVTGVSAFSAQALSTRDGFRSNRIQVIENGIDVSRYERPVDREALRRRLQLDPDRRYIATIARFHPVKDHPTLLRAFAIVSKAIDDVDLLLAGDGPLRPELERLVDELGIQGRVRFLGVRSDVADLLAAADLFALSSLSEAASLTVLEAMASGTPVVVTDVGGNPEMIRRGVDGQLTPRGDATAMAETMIRVLREPQLAASMAARAAERARTTYPLERTVDRYYELYRELSRQDLPRSA